MATMAEIGVIPMHPHPTPKDKHVTDAPHPLG